MSRAKHAARTRLLDAEGKRKVRAMNEMATALYLIRPDAFHAFAKQMLVQLVRTRRAS